jgi:folate-binding protein YgfZ
VSARLIDRSERGKLALSGPDRKAFLNGQVTNDIEALEPGTGCYAAFLTPKGKMLGDDRVLDVGPPTPELLLDTERVALQALFDVLRRAMIGHAVELHKRTLECGLLSLVGAGVGGSGSSEHAHRTDEIGGRPVRVITTDVGIDILCAAEDTETVAAALVADGAERASEDDAEIVRVELGRPRYGVDLDDSVIPQEAGLNDRAVSFTKGCYVGQETVARLFYKGKPNRHLRGIRLAEPAAPGTPLTVEGKEVGRLTSPVVSPTLGPIGLALVRREAPPGTRLDDGSAVVELPFGK